MTIADWENLAVILSFFLYLAATLCYMAHLFNIQRHSGEIATMLACCGLALHSAAILLRTIEAGRVPLSNQFEFASIFAWGIVLAYLALERSLRFRYRSCGAFVSCGGRVGRSKRPA
jgi:ABC-type transport system involved in cytochrome c biogenesis permease subunit